jgi:hypothetical protein
MLHAGEINDVVVSHSENGPSTPVLLGIPDASTVSQRKAHLHHPEL